MNRRNVLAGALAGLPFATPAQVNGTTRTPAQARIVVPVPAGGTADFTAALLAPLISQALGEPVKVVFRPGESGRVAGNLVAAAPPDGRTLLVTYSGFQIVHPLVATGQADPLYADLAPIGLLTRAPHIVAAGRHIDAQTLAAFIARARAAVKPLTYGSIGVGSLQHIAAESFQRLTGTRMSNITYRGAGPIALDLVGGLVDAAISTPASLIGAIRSGKVTGLAIAGPQRLSALPDIPTAAKAGLPGFEIESWFGLYAPPRTPPAIIERLADAVRGMAGDREAREKAAEGGTTITPSTPGELSAFVEEEHRRWRRIVQTTPFPRD
jgi:tripartite-type tricarboxylate transporter receptor subunit TctC